MECIYCRVSSDRQTVEQQISACEALLDGNDQKVVTIQETRPGWDTDGRRGYQRLRRMIEAGEVKTVVAWKLDRLGRKAREILDFFEMCEKKGCAVKLVTEQINTAGPFGKMSVFILGTLAEMETANMSERTRAKFDAYREEFDYHGHGGPGNWFSEKALKKEKMVRSLYKDGWKKWTIAQEVGLDYRTICKLLKTPEGQCMSKAEIVKANPDWYVTPAEQRRKYLEAHPPERCRNSLDRTK
jgi:DNA invertase Pin-like site-specific DNA recombinase